MEVALIALNTCLYALFHTIANIAVTAEIPIKYVDVLELTRSDTLSSDYRSTPHHRPFTACHDRDFIQDAEANKNGCVEARGKLEVRETGERHSLRCRS